MAAKAMPLNVPRRLGQREIDLIEQLAHSQLEMTPRQFEAKWDVDRSQIAALCHCSWGNVKRWLKTDENYRSPTKYHRRYLALSNLDLEHLEQLPPELQQLICRSRSVYYQSWSSLTRSISSGLRGKNGTIDAFECLDALHSNYR